MDAFDDFLVYQKIWERAQALEVTICYSPDPGKPAMRGYFTPQEAHYNKNEARPEISITRLGASGCEPNRGDLTPEQLRRELFTLAHEYGHFMSWKRSKDAGGVERDKWEQYHADAKTRDEIMRRLQRELLPSGLSMLEWNERLRRAVHDRLDEGARTRIIHEESLASEIGRQVLEELGFTDLAVYDAYATKGLHNHRYRLGMEDLWPGDELGEISNE